MLGWGVPVFLVRVLLYTVFLSHDASLFGCRGDMQHDHLAIAYQLLLDNRNISKASSFPIPMDPSGSPPRSFSMSEDVIAEVRDTPTIKKQVLEV